MTISKLEDIRSALHQALEVLAPVRECALLDYPANYNLGDHLIWLGTIFYLSSLNIKIKYATSITDFSKAQLEQKVGDAPILLNGGGNLGDLWPKFQSFREQIVSQYRDRPVFILPQSIYFRYQDNLKKAAEIFNAHPDLTLFVRDNYSYKIATEYFVNCRVVKSPDMAFELVNLPKLPITQNSNSILYLCRNDREKKSSFSPAALEIPNLVVEDWISFQWMSKLPEDWIYIPGLVRLIREGWQRGFANPVEWLSRQKWEKLHPCATYFSHLDRPGIHRKSWSMMHSGIYQLKKHRLFITDRLHAHILGLLLNIPHVVLPGSYYKIEAFYNTWTYQLPFARLVTDPAQVKVALEKLSSDCQVNQ